MQFRQLNILNQPANLLVNRKIVLHHRHEDDMLFRAYYEHNITEPAAKQKLDALQ